MENFKALGVKPDFIKGLNDLGIINPTEIQTASYSFIIRWKY